MPGHADLEPGEGLTLFAAVPMSLQRVANVERAQMLVKADKSSDHQPIIPYLEIMRAAMGTAATEMGRRLQEELRK